MGNALNLVTAVGTQFIYNEAGGIIAVAAIDGDLGSMELGSIVWARTGNRTEAAKSSFKSRPQLVDGSDIFALHRKIYALESDLERMRGAMREQNKLILEHTLGVARDQK